MEKEQILSTLTSKLGKTSLSSRSIETYVNNNLPSEGTEPDDAFFEKHVQILKSIEGQFSHDVATAIENFKKTYKPEPEVEETHADDKYEKLLKEVEELKASHKEQLERVSAENLRTSVSGKAAELNVSSYKKAWDHVVKNADLSDCKTEDEALTKVKGEFESFVKELYGDSASPYGKGETGPKYSDTEAKKRRKAYLERMEREGKIPSGNN